VRVILDECIPRPLGAELTGHLVTTVQKQGWAGTTNGKLLRHIESAGFEAFVTLDRNLPHQQTLRGRAFGVVVLKARSTRLIDLAPLAPGILSALAEIGPGKVVYVGQD